MVKEVSPFVGRSRLQLVKGLVEIHDRVCSSGESRWMSLEAPSGWGKTRVGKRFYAELSARQTKELPRYWPATLGETNRDDRKVVVPRGEREEGSLPTFLWWGMSCSSDDRFSAPALREGLSELVSHSQYVSIACRDRQTKGERAIEKLRNEVWEFAEGGAVEAVSQAAAAIGVALPGMGLAVLAGRKVLGAAKSQRADSRLVADASELGASTGGLVEDLVEQLRQIGRARFPVVLFVEDIHFADEALLKALDAMLRRVSHLLVVTTAWPGRIDQITELSRLTWELDEQVVRVRHDAPTPEALPAGAGLAELDSSDCRKIVLAHYEHADPETADLLANRYRNPGALDLVCSMEGFKEDFGERGDLYISREEVDDLPAATEDLYRAYWDQLPKSTRLQYAVAAAISPASISPDEGAGHHTWSAPVLNDVMRSLNLPAAADLHSTIGASTDAYGWVTHVDEYLRRWSEIDQHHIATDAGRTLLKQHRRARKAILTAVADVMLSDAEPSAHAARTIAALHAEGFITNVVPATKAVAVLLADLGYDDTAASERRRLYEHYRELVEHVSPDEQTDFEVRLNGIEAIASSGHAEVAAQHYRELLARAEGSLGPNHPTTLEIRSNLAWTLRDAGQVDESIRINEQILADSIRVLTADHPDTLAAGHNLAGALSEAGRVDEAIRIYEQVLADSIRVLTADHPDTLATQNDLAGEHREAGRVDEAIRIYEEVVAARTRVLTADHPDTLRSRDDLAWTLLEAGRVGEAIDLLEEVVAKRTSVLGADHPTTLVSRNNRGWALQAAGRLDEAISVLEEVVAERTRVLRADHPDTLTSRNNLAGALHAAGRREEAIPMVEEVVAERTRVLTADHPATLLSRDNLAVALRDAGRIDEAIGIFEAVLADRIRVLTADHPDTLTSRDNLARALLDAGRIDEAIGIFEAVLADRIRVLSADHPDISASRDILARARRASGRAD